MVPSEKQLMLGSVIGLAAAIAAAFAAVVFYPADPLEMKLDAPASVAAGEIAVLDVSKTGADSYAYSVTPPAKCHVFENGTKLVFASGTAGEYVFIVVGAKGGKVGLVEHDLTVTGGVEPGPDVADFASKLKRAIAGVKDDAKAEHLAALANTFTTVASMIGAGVLDTPEDVVTATLNLNVQALGSARDAWQPVQAVINAELSTRAEAGALETAEQHAAVWREIAELLKGAN